MAMTKCVIKVGTETLYAGAFSSEEVRRIKADWKETLGDIMKGRATNGRNTGK